MKGGYVEKKGLSAFILITLNFALNFFIAIVYYIECTVVFRNCDNLSYLITLLITFLISLKID